VAAALPSLTTLDMCGVVTRPYVDRPGSFYCDEADGGPEALEAWVRDLADRATADRAQLANNMGLRFTFDGIEFASTPMRADGNWKGSA